MHTIQLQLDSIHDVKQFVQAVALCDFDVDIQAGRYVVDAKSIMGLFSLDLSQPVTAHIYCDECADLLAKISAFIVKE